jgi:hypothetical protein
VFELVCHECQVYSDAHGFGWRGCRVDNPDENEPPELAFYCPECADREFGPLRMAGPQIDELS